MVKKLLYKCCIFQLVEIHALALPLSAPGQSLLDPIFTQYTPAYLHQLDPCQRNQVGYDFYVNFNILWSQLEVLLNGEKTLLCRQQGKHIKSSNFDVFGRILLKWIKFNSVYIIFQQVYNINRIEFKFIANFFILHTIDIRKLLFNN